MARYEKILGYYRYPDTSDERWNTKQKKNEKKKTKKKRKKGKGAREKIKSKVGGISTLQLQLHFALERARAPAQSKGEPT